MQYRTVEYAVRARPGRDEWIWTIYPKGAASIHRDYTGPRQEAVDAACRAIDRWLAEHRKKNAKM
jgi:hypothetical protein